MRSATDTTSKPAARVRPIQLGPGNPVDTFRWLRADAAPFVAVAAGDAPGPASEAPRLVGLGVDGDRTAAAQAAISEVVERQSAFRLPRAPVSYAAAAELDDPIPTADLDPNVSGWWVRGTDVHTGHGGSVPLEAVQFAAPVRRPLTGLRTDSTGMAVHVDEELAVQAGRRELAERALRRSLLDAPVRVRWSPRELPEPTARWAAELLDRGCSLTVVPAGSPAWTVCVVLVGGCAPDGRALLVGGSAAADTAQFAAERAVAEAFAKAEVCALRGEPGPSHPSATSAAVDAALLADWLDWWGAERVSEAGLDVEIPRLDGESCGTELVFDRGSAYTDAVALHCRQVVRPGARVDLPERLTAAGGAELFA